jgi:hypothetical protein
VRRRASILLEVLLATAVFAFAGIVVLGVVDGAVADGGRAARRSLAMDLARSEMARIEAGIPADEDVSLAVDGMRVEWRLEPCDFPGLALAVVEVFDEERSAATGDDPVRAAVLRQLVRGDGGAGADRPEVSR